MNFGGLLFKPPGSLIYCSDLTRSHLVQSTCLLGNYV